MSTESVWDIGKQGWKIGSTHACSNARKGFGSKAKKRVRVVCGTKRKRLENNMRVKKQKVQGVKLPNELFVQPMLLDQLASNQDAGLIYYGECIYPPWRRQRKSSTQKKYASPPKFAASDSNIQVLPSRASTQRVVTKTFRPYTAKENEIIIREKEKNGTTWNDLALLLPGRTSWQIKKHYHAKLKNRPNGPGLRNKDAAATSAIPNSGDKTTSKPNKTAETTTQVVPPKTIDLVPVTKEDLEHKLYNKIVTVPSRLDASKKRRQLYFVLNYNEVEGKCHLVPLMENGVFTSDDDKKGKKRWKLVPEGEGEELVNIPANTCTIIKSVATNKVQDADQEAWQILDVQYQ